MCGEGICIYGRARGYSMTGIEKLRRGGDILNFGYCTYLTVSILIMPRNEAHGSDSGLQLLLWLTVLLDCIISLPFPPFTILRVAKTSSLP